MNLNREKIACCVALLIFLAGMYTVVLSFINPSQIRRPPNTNISRVDDREVFMPRSRDYVGSEAAGRNPFSFSEGWKDLDAVSLLPPSIPDRSRILPVLSGGVPPTDGGVYFSEDRPREIDAGSGASAGAASGSGVAPGATPGIVPVPKGGLLEVPGTTGSGGGKDE